MVRTRHLALRVLHMPGHTPGLLCLHDPEQRALLLRRPPAREGLAEPAHRARAGRARRTSSGRSSRTSRASSGRARSTSTSSCPATAHRSPATARVIDQLLAFYAKRQARIRELVAAGPLTAYEISLAPLPVGAPGDDLPHRLGDDREPRGRWRRAARCSARSWTAATGFARTPRHARAHRPRRDLDLSRHAVGDGDRPRHRQHRLPLDPRREAAARAAAGGAPARPRVRARDPAPPPLRHHLGDGAHARALLAARSRPGPAGTSSSSGAASSSSPRRPSRSTTSSR